MILRRLVLLLIGVILTFSLINCGSSRTLEASSKPITKISVQSLLDSHHGSAANFSHLQGKLRISLLNDGREMGYNLSMRMAKDEKLWLNATLNIVRVMATTQGVQFYNKIDRTYFEGSFGVLSKWLGIELNFSQLQNLILGQAIMDYAARDLDLTFSDTQYQLRTKNSVGTDYRIRINAGRLLADQQYFAQSEGERSVTINYLSYQTIGDKTIPEVIVLTARDGNEVTQLELNLLDLSFVDQLNFPFNIPSGYQRTEL